MSDYVALMFEDIARNAEGAPQSPNKGFFVSGLRPGGPVTGQLAVVRSESRATRAGKPYLSVLLSDRTGQIEAKDWDHAGENEAVFEPGTVVKVRATVEEYNGEKQLKIEKARRSQPGEYHPGDFVPVSIYDTDGMYAALGDVISGVRDPWVRKLLETVHCRYAEGWKVSAAAMRIHHAFAGGLLEHVLSMCRAALALCTHYSLLDRDVLIAGCILHDLGKMREIETGIAIAHSVPGKLVGHIAEGLIMLEDCCRGIDEFPEETRMLLRHMIISHHGSFEFGALRLPMTPEAIVLSALDDLDFKLECAFHVIAAGGAEPFSGWLKPLEREIYRVRREMPADAGQGPDGPAE